jgi:signal transduction histidine kinase
MTRIKEIENRIDNVKNLTQLILLGMSVFSISFALLFSRYITHHLRRLRESTSTIAKGEFDFNPRGYPQDEIGDLASAFFDMAYDLKKTQDELIRKRRLAAIGEIVASVNHEINNPLMIISGNAQFLEMTIDNGVTQDTRERIHAILEETERISQVTRKLRDIKNPVVEDYTSSGEQMINLDKSAD